MSEKETADVINKMKDNIPKSPVKKTNMVSQIKKMIKKHGADSLIGICAQDLINIYERKQ